MRALLHAKWQQFTEWVSWKAWNYARKRAIANATLLPIEAAQARSDDSPGRRRTTANEARQLLENEHLKNAFSAVELTLEDAAQSCDQDDKEKAQRIVIAKQLMAWVKREIVRKIEDGYMAEVEIAELERSKLVTRFVR